MKCCFQFVNIFTSLSSCLELLDNFSVHPQSEAKLKQDASDTAKPAKKKKSKQEKTKDTEKDNPRILAMAEQMQAQSVVQNSEHHMAEAESRLQGKGTTSSSTSLRDRPDPDPAENPQTPPSTPLAATSATEGNEYDYGPF